MAKLITIVTPCYNEEGNIRELYSRVKDLFSTLSQYRYEHLFIDNASEDRTAEILRELAAQDPQVKVILNTRNFGHIRSPYHALLQSEGDATILMAGDLQDPPDVLPKFLEAWEKGFRVVLGIKTSSEESPFFYLLRTAYYHLVAKLSEVPLSKHNTGFGLYDRTVIQTLRKIREPYPYFRGLISELGYPTAKVDFRQPQRKRGISSNNFYRLYDIAMLGITNHSKIPLRIATIAGFGMSFMSLLIAIGYLIAKLTFWYKFPIGMAPILIGIFFFSSVQLFFIGILGEYIGAIHTYAQDRPLVIEKERINF